MANILSVRGLSFGYQSNQVLRGVDLEIPQGSIFGYLGKEKMERENLLQSSCY